MENRKDYEKKHLDVKEKRNIENIRDQAAESWIVRELREKEELEKFHSDKEISFLLPEKQSYVIYSSIPKIPRCSSEYNLSKLRLSFCTELVLKWNQIIIIKMETKFSTLCK